VASRRLAVSAHAPGNEDSPDNMAGVYDDWTMVLLAETGSHRLLVFGWNLKFPVILGHRTLHVALELVATSVHGCAIGMQTRPGRMPARLMSSEEIALRAGLG